MYCIIDVETTGGKSHEHRITEIAMVKHDGQQVLDTFSSLVNPERLIPAFITRLTGITNEMVAEAPKFYEIAKQVVEFTQGCVFVAHNAQFDYSFVRKEFAELGYAYTRKTLCTVRLARRLVPGLKRYRLSTLCAHFQIELKGHHRALNDALATAELFRKLWNINEEKASLKSLQSEVRTTLLPRNLPYETFEQLPRETGVYYFLNKQGDVVYVGKSKNIKARVAQHFQSHQHNKKGDKFRDSIFDIQYEKTGNELIALLEESHQIKRLRPRFNIAQKKKDMQYGLFHRYNPEGFLEFYLEKLSTENGPQALTQFPSKRSGTHALSVWCERLELCKNFCSLMGSSLSMCILHEASSCRGSCQGQETPAEYNKRAHTLLERFSFHCQNFFIKGQGRTADEQSLVLVKDGIYQGYGYVPKNQNFNEKEAIAGYLKVRKDNKDIQRILKGYLKKHPQNLMEQQEKYNQLTFV